MAEKKKVEKTEEAPTLKQRAVKAYGILWRIFAFVVLIAFVAFCAWFIYVRVWSAGPLLNATYTDTGVALWAMKTMVNLKIILPILTAAALVYVALQQAKVQINPPNSKKH